MQWEDGNVVPRASLFAAEGCDPPPPIPCPPTPEHLGGSTWTALHSLTSSLGQGQLSEQQSQALMALVRAVINLYPPLHGGPVNSDLWEPMPQEFATADVFDQYLCEVHNKYNDVAGKDTFDCTRSVERWDTLAQPTPGCVPAAF